MSNRCGRGRGSGVGGRSEDETDWDGRLINATILIMMKKPCATTPMWNSKRTMDAHTANMLQRRRGSLKGDVGWRELYQLRHTSPKGGKMSTWQVTARKFHNANAQRSSSLSPSSSSYLLIGSSIVCPSWGQARNQLTPTLISWAWLCFWDTQGGFVSCQLAKKDEMEEKERERDATQIGLEATRATTQDKLAEGSGRGGEKHTLIGLTNACGTALSSEIAQVCLWCGSDLDRHQGNMCVHKICWPMVRMINAWWSTVAHRNEQHFQFAEHRSFCESIKSEYNIQCLISFEYIWSDIPSMHCI